MHDAVTHPIAIDQLGEQLSGLRLCEPAALAAVQRSLEAHGQLTPLLLFADGGVLEIVDGFKRVRAARALGWRQLAARVDSVGRVEAKLRLRDVHQGRALCELEEAWLVRSLYRDDGLSLALIATRMRRHKSWVWRRLMLVEALVPTVQNDVRLGIIAARAAVAVSRLPRGNQEGASAVVARLGLTVRQTELLVDEITREREPVARAALIARRLDEPPPAARLGPRPARAARDEADWMSADIVRVRDLAARLEARLVDTPLESLTPSAAELIRGALVHLVPVLRALEKVIGTVTLAREVM